MTEKINDNEYQHWLKHNTTNPTDKDLQKMATITMTEQSRNNITTWKI